MSDIIPFGKYKGQPVEVLMQDRSYLEWLSGQDWFRQRYAALYQTVVVNNFTEPSETPEHNALQVLFLDEAFCAAFVEAICPGAISRCTEKMEIAAATAISEGRPKIVSMLKEKRKEVEDATRELNDGTALTEWYRNSLQQKIKEQTDLQEMLLQLDVPVALETVFSTQFEQHGIDVILYWGIRTRSPIPRCYPTYRGSTHFHVHSASMRSEDYDKANNLSIEIKPSISDDYPAVLRQMHANHSKVLFVGKFNAAGASRDQFLKVFKSSGITVVFRDDVKWSAESGAQD